MADNDEVEVRRKVAVYQVPTDDIDREPATVRSRSVYDMDVMTTVTPVDRVRWGPILAGLFTAVTTMAVLNVLGLAIGFSAYNAGDFTTNLGIGASIWGTLSALIAFALGGWLAARTAAVPGYGNGMLNGIMVWMVTIPLLLYLLGASFGGLLNLTGGLIATTTQIMAPISAQLGLPVDNAPATGGQQATPPTPAPSEAINLAGITVWGMLLALVLGLGAAALGGLLGARPARAVYRAG